MRQQLRYLVPAAAAAALVAMVVRYGGMTPGAPPTARDGRVPGQEVSERAPDSAGVRTAKAKPESDGQGRTSAGAGRDATDSVAPARATKKGDGTAVARPVPQPAPAKERFASVPREERDRLADRPLPETIERTSRDRAAAPAAISAPSDGHGWPSAGAGRDTPDSAAPAPAAEPQLAAKAESASGMNMAKVPSAEAPSEVSLGKTRSKEGPSSLASAPSHDASPCERARALAVQERWREAEAVQRACLSQDPSAPAQEKGLVFLAELLDRQARFAEADALIADVDRQFPQSRPLDLYRQQRPMVQKQPMTAPVTR